MSIDKYQQSMENWKKEIIIDPHLNSLFDSSVSSQQFLRNKILHLPHEDIIKTYMKLTSLKHAITKNMQKEIQVRHGLIQQSFNNSLRSKNSFEEINKDKMKDYLKLISKFNQKYQLISSRITQIKNINTILHFSQALQKFKVNARLLKSMMQDFDQNNTSKLQIQLLNTLKISKIIRQISSITVKFDFSGIRSYQTQRHFINNTKGAIFGLVQKQLTSILDKIPSLSQGRKEQVEKDIINKFIVLNNMVKLKDFCISYYKNKLKQMSILIRKSIQKGQPSERDPKIYIQTFEKYFKQEVSKKIVENSIIFIAFDQLLGKSTIKTPFAINFFQKYWENITGFMKDWITFSIQNGGVEVGKDKKSQSLVQSFNILDTKGQYSKYLMFIIWKYPILVESLTSISNNIHLHIIQHTQYNHYQFQSMKQQFLKVLIPLAQLYYKNIDNFYSKWKDKLNRQNIKQLINDEKVDNLPVKIVVILFDDNNSEKMSTIDNYLRVVEWLIFNIETKQIFDAHTQKILSIIDSYFSAFGHVVKNCSKQNQNKDDFEHFIEKCSIFVSKMKNGILRGKESSEEFEPFIVSSNNKKGILTSSCSSMISTLKKFKRYQGLLTQWSNKN